MYYFWTVGSVVIGKGKGQCTHSEARGVAAAAGAAEALLGGR